MKKAKKTIARTNKSHTVTATGHTLARWAFWAPLKFALWSFVISVCLSAVYGAIATILGNTVKSNMIILITLVVNLFAIYKTIKYLKSEYIGQRGLVAVLNTSLINLCISIAIFAFGFIKLVPMFYIIRFVPSAKNATILIISAILMGIIATYMLGLLISSIYAIYVRCVSMGVSKTKSLCTLPFCPMWVAGYATSDKKTSGADVRINSRIFAAITDWVVSTPLNTALTILIFIALYLLCVGLGSVFFATAIIPAIMYVLWIAIRSRENLRKTIGGTFSTFAVILNVLTLCTFIWFAVSQHNVSASTQNQTVINITERTVEQK